MDLDKEGCKVFVCPSISDIDILCKKLELDDKVVNHAKHIAIEYLRKTYHKPTYSHVKFILPSCVYVASILQARSRSQIEVSEASRISPTTIRKWAVNIVNELDIEVIW